MAITTAAIDALPDYSAAQQLKMWKYASVALASGESYQINGRTLSRANAEEVRQMIQFWQEQVTADGGDDGAALIVFGEPQ